MVRAEADSPVGLGVAAQADGLCCNTKVRPEAHWPCPAESGGNVWGNLREAGPGVRLGLGPAGLRWCPREGLSRAGEWQGKGYRLSSTNNY